MAELVAGVDECGRGSLYGNVVAAAVVLPDVAAFPDDTWRQIKDSKKLSAKKRETLAAYIKEHAVTWGIGEATPAEIDRHNILRATMRAMVRALDAAYAKRPFDAIEVDGTYFIPYRQPNAVDLTVIPHTCVVRGDATHMNIAAASIIAKVHHDAEIKQMLVDYPDHVVYGLKTNMGYGTAVHMEALRTHGRSPFHRVSFAPVAAAAPAPVVTPALLARDNVVE